MYWEIKIQLDFRCFAGVLLGLCCSGPSVKHRCITAWTRCEPSRRPPPPAGEPQPDLGLLPLASHQRSHGNCLNLQGRRHSDWICGTMAPGSKPSLAARCSKFTKPELPGVGEGVGGLFHHLLGTDELNFAPATAD